MPGPRQERAREGEEPPEREEQQVAGAVTRADLAQACERAEAAWRKSSALAVAATYTALDAVRALMLGLAARCVVLQGLRLSPVLLPVPHPPRTVCQRAGVRRFDVTLPQWLLNAVVGEEAGETLKQVASDPSMAKFNASIAGRA